MSSGPFKLLDERFGFFAFNVESGCDSGECLRVTSGRGDPLILFMSRKFTQIAGLSSLI